MTSKEAIAPLENMRKQAGVDWKMLVGRLDGVEKNYNDLGQRLMDVDERMQMTMADMSGMLREPLYGHIDGTTPAPPHYIDREVKRTVVADQGSGALTGSEIRFEYETVTENNPAYEVWLAHDQSLIAYITSTLSEEVLGGVDDDLTALELGSTLATTYSQVSEARFLQLRRQFQDIKHGMRTVLEYLNEIKSVSDQLAAIGHPVSDKDKVQQALSGLGTEFDIFCTALEVLPILPSFEDLKAKLFQHEASHVQRDSCNARASYPSLDPSGRNGKRYSSNPSRREGKAAAGAASSSSGQNMTYNIPADAQQLLMTVISKLQLKQNEQGEWYVDSGAAAHVTGDTDMLNALRQRKIQKEMEEADVGYNEPWEAEEEEEEAYENVDDDEDDSSLRTNLESSRGRDRRGKGIMYEGGRSGITGRKRRSTMSHALRKNQLQYLMMKILNASTLNLKQHKALLMKESLLVLVVNMLVRFFPFLTMKMKKKMEMKMMKIMNESQNDIVMNFDAYE
ncbi:hypothetical protein EJ110_NYTH55801 [Nymphaea thermarum]|nr:hypothetical protein EJ110_NYTH55801 [Nymphaea thermarum]